MYDTETTTDYAQGLLFGFYRLYVDDVLADERLIVADDLKGRDRLLASNFAQVFDLEIMTRTEFVDEIFYPEVYMRGALCVGFNLPFDLSRIAIAAGAGTGEHRRKFSFLLSRQKRWPRLRIEAISSRGAFIEFAPKHKRLMRKWERPFFSGRFLDLSTLVVAFTGERQSLRSAGLLFDAKVKKADTPELGAVTPEALHYGRIDVEATWSLFERLREEYMAHPFASMENERRQLASGLRITKIFSTASIAKQYLRLMGIRPLLEQQPRFNRKYLGYAAAAYYGGRAETRVRRVDVPVVVLDATSMYPTVFLLQNLQSLLTAEKTGVRRVTSQTQELLDRITLDDLYDPSTWPQLSRLVRIHPDDDILPVRFKLLPDDDDNKPAPFSISITRFTSSDDRWYTLADAIDSKLQTGKAPRISEALEFYAKGMQPMQPVRMRNATHIKRGDQIFKTVVEQRQTAKRAKESGADPELARLDLALKGFANSGAYGIHYEVNVTPSPATHPHAGTVYSDETYESANVHDERPGTFCNPIIASFVTGGARLILGMLEHEVALRGGTFAFCDTDSLAMVSGENCPPGILGLSQNGINEIIAKFDRLNPYDPKLVPHVLKREFVKFPGLRCFAISAKRYVLFQLLPGGNFGIIKPSESGLGGIIGRTKDENTKQLATAIWSDILVTELGSKYNFSAHSALQQLRKFDVVARRKIPLSQPQILNNSGFKAFNRRRNYSKQIKPFGFIQSVMPPIKHRREEQPIAPYEADERKSRTLPWVDLKTGQKIVIDWNRTGLRGTVAAMTMAEYIQRYRTHPEAKAADKMGRPAGEETRGVLGRLHLSADEPVRIGKEVDRLDEDDGLQLLEAGPVVYSQSSKTRSRHSAQYAQAIRDLRLVRPRYCLAEELGISARRLGDILKGKVDPRPRLKAAIIRLAARVEVEGALKPLGFVTATRTRTRRKLPAKDQLRQN